MAGRNRQPFAEPENWIPAGTARAMKDQHGIRDPPIGIADRLAEGRVMQAQFGQGFPRFEMEVVGDVVALLRRHKDRRLLGA